MTNYATNSQTDKELLEKIDKELAAGHAVLETVTTTAPPATTTTDTKPAKPKRTYLKVSDRMRIIDQFKHGIADPYYSVNPNPKKPGEYIVRKRKTPITYDLNTNTTNNFSPQATTAPPATTTTDTNNDTDTTSSDKKSNLGVEFFSVLSSTNASLQRELQSLTDKYNKLDSKLRKERAKRKGQQVTHVSAAAAPATKTKQADNKTKAKTVTDTTTDKTTDNTTNDNEYEYEYEYEYPDEPNTTSQQVSQDVPPQPEVPLRYVPYIRRKQINIYDF